MNDCSERQQNNTNMEIIPHTLILTMKKSNFCEKPSSPFKNKKCNTQKNYKKRVRKSIFPFRKKLLKSQDLAKRKIIRDTSFFTKCGYECILLKTL